MKLLNTNVYLLCSYWGSEHLDIDPFLQKVKEQGYDGVDMWVPEDKKERQRLLSLLEQYDLKIVSHQHQATGNNIGEFTRSFDYFLELSAEVNPLLINSHSGKDYFSLDDQLRILDTASDFEIKTGYEVCHETHRGRMLFCPGAAQTLFDQRPSIKITGDYSHWVCVTESYLEGFTQTLQEAVSRTRHVHARVGFPEGPQVPDPRLSAYSDALLFFTELWQQILTTQVAQQVPFITFTPEFGPPPYMWTRLDNQLPVADQWEINRFIKNKIQQLIR